METCSRCGKDISKPEATTCAIGFAYDENGLVVCYKCCATIDRQYMHDHGKITLYLTPSPSPVGSIKTGYNVINWPGTLGFRCVRVALGRNNIGRKRIDVWFEDNVLGYWHGVQYGENTQLIHCKKITPQAYRRSVG